MTACGAAVGAGARALYVCSHRMPLRGLHGSAALMASGLPCVVARPLRMVIRVRRLGSALAGTGCLR